MQPKIQTNIHQQMGIDTSLWVASVSGTLGHNSPSSTPSWPDPARTAKKTDLNPVAKEILQSLLGPHTQMSAACGGGRAENS